MGRSRRSPPVRRRPRPSRPGRYLALVVLAVAIGVAPGLAGEGNEAVDRPLEARLERLEGGKLRLSELRGEPLLLDFWATWCLPCREQSRTLHDLREELAERGVAVLAVNLAEKPSVVREFLAETPSEVPVALDRFRILADRIGVATLPTLALLRSDGSLAAVRSGSSSRQDVLDLLATLDAARGERATSLRSSRGGSSRRWRRCGESGRDCRRTSSTG